MTARRDFLRQAGCAGLSWAAGALSSPAWSSPQGAAPLTTLPLATSLPEALAEALQQNNPLVVLVSLDGCPFCKTVRQSHLGPMWLEEKLPILQVDMRSARAVLDFDAQPSTHDALVRRWQIRVAPTVLFFGAGGRELAPRLSGAGLPDFYGTYLAQRLDSARQTLKKIPA